MAADDPTVLAIELENGRFTGVASNAPEQFEDVEVVIMNREVAGGEATGDPLAGIDLTPVEVESIDSADGAATTFNAGRVNVSASTWALDAMMAAMREPEEGEAVPTEEEDEVDDSDQEEDEAA